LVLYVDQSQIQSGSILRRDITWPMSHNLWVTKAGTEYYQSVLVQVHSTIVNAASKLGFLGHSFPTP
jgi:hypothetical protein